MKFKLILTKNAENFILAHTIKRKNLVIKKGKVLDKEYISLLLNNKIQKVYVAIIEKYDYSENLSARLIAEHIAPNKLFKIIVSNGRADIFTKVQGLLNIKKENLLKMNAKFNNIAISTLKNKSIVKKGQLIGNVKILPYAISKREILKIINNLQYKRVFHVSKKTINKIGLIFTSNDAKNFNKKKLLNAIDSRLNKFNLEVSLTEFCEHNHKILSNQIKKILKKNIELLLIYGETSISDINDVVPRSIVDIKGKIISSIMPTDPGNLLLVGTVNNVIIIGVPGCAKSPSRNGFDDILERVCHGEKFNKKKIAEIAIGGLYKNIVRNLDEKVSLR